MGWDFPDYELTPEKANELIDKIANYVVRSGLEFPAIMALESIKPVAYFSSQLGIVVLAPILPILGEWGNDAIGLFQERGNVEKLIQRIEALVEGRKKEEERKKMESEAQKEKGGGKRKSFFRSLFGR